MIENSPLSGEFQKGEAYSCQKEALLCYKKVVLTSVVAKESDNGWSKFRAHALELQISYCVCTEIQAQNYLWQIQEINWPDIKEVVWVQKDWDIRSACMCWSCPHVHNKLKRISSDCIGQSGKQCVSLILPMALAKFSSRPIVPPTVAQLDST